MELKELRLSKKITQSEAAEYVGIPLRTYQNYENDKAKKDSIKYRYILNQLTKIGYIDEEHGILSLDMIISSCQEVFNDYKVDYCYLFGSYAKNIAHEKSDVDLLISTPVSGLDFYGMVENLRRKLHKPVDVLTVSQLNDNTDLLHEILKDGVKVYRQ